VGWGRGMPKRVSGLGPRRIDQLFALFGIVGAWWNAAREPHADLNALALVALAVLMGTVAWRRANPVVTTIVASVALIVFQVVSLYGGDGTFEAAAIAFNFYILGQQARGRHPGGWYAICFAAWLVAAWVITYDPGSGSVGEVVGTWAVFGPLPFVCGFLLAERTALTGDLQTRSVQLDAEQSYRSREAATQERSRMARELHDVIAHCLSVMVVQTGGARSVAAADPDGAREALRVVERAGREALADLRRLVGTLRRGEQFERRYGIGEIEQLVEHARAAGMSVALEIDGKAVTDPDVAVVAYRIVQEALTNTIKHASSAGTRVRVHRDGDSLAITVANGAPAKPRASAVEGSGHGLVGMRERVARLGGVLDAGPTETGGFEVHARLPLQPPSAEGDAPPGDEGATDEGRWTWADWAFAGLLFVAVEVAVFTSGDIQGPLPLNALVVGAAAAAAAWRRRYPLAFTLLVETAAVVMTLTLTPVRDLPIVAAFVLIVPTYTLGAWADPTRAALGLTAIFALAIADHVAAHNGTTASLIGAGFLAVAAWGFGWAVRSRRLRNAELTQSVARIALEGDDRARLAVAAERSRISRELNQALASSVSAMVVQAEAARLLLENEPVAADLAMAAVEDMGRQALSEMRRILGSLRQPSESADLQPLPGVDQVYRLIQHARNDGRPVELRVDGVPGTIPTTVELGVYRVVEEALHTAAIPSRETVSVSLLFERDSLQLQLAAPWHGANGWPTDTMRERIALCGGAIEPAPETEGWQLNARLPYALEGAFQ